MGLLPHISDLERIDDDDDPLDDTQPRDPVPLRRQMIETALTTDAPLTDSVDRLMDYWDDTQFVRDWARSMRRIINRMRSQAQHTGCHSGQWFD